MKELHEYMTEPDLTSRDLIDWLTLGKCPPVPPDRRKVVPYRDKPRFPVHTNLKRDRSQKHGESEGNRYYHSG